jgi:hypothetical protein
MKRPFKCKLDRHAGLLLKNRIRWGRATFADALVRTDPFFGIERRELIEIRHLLSYYMLPQDWHGSVGQRQFERIVQTAFRVYHRARNGEDV